MASSLPVELASLDKSWCILMRCAFVLYKLVFTMNLYKIYLILLFRRVCLHTLRGCKTYLIVLKSLSMQANGPKLVLFVSLCKFSLLVQLT